MSNELAIGAVTLTLRNLLGKLEELRDSEVEDDLPEDLRLTEEIRITNLPLDKAQEPQLGRNQVNIFLYHVEHSAAWRNQELPGRIKNGESGHPPLGLNLYYIITAYGQGENEIIGHLLLGKAMSILHDHPVLSREEIRTAFVASRLHEQIERVRITPQPITLDEVSKLWAGFQTQYKLSIAYQLSVVLIESKRPSTTPLPVLMRGPEDRGVLLQPYVTPPFPYIESIEFPNKQNAAQLSDVLTIKGSRLKGDSVTIRFKNRRLNSPIEIAAMAGATDEQVKVQIPNAPNLWPAGMYALTVVVHKASSADKTSNDLPFMLAPVVNFPIAIVPAPPPGSKNYTATVTFNPAIRPEQDAYLLAGNREFKSAEHAAVANSLNFEMKDVEDGSYFIRLRIDGSDSLLIDTSVTPPVFKASNKIVLP